jgi:hypothetical protein
METYMTQLLLHLLGDYIIQNDWMALNKQEPTAKGFFACAIHSITYALPFLFIGSWQAVFVIFITHFLIDRWDWLRYVLAFRNGINYVFNLGYNEDRPFTVAVVIYIITENSLHLFINYFSLLYL